MRLHHARTTSIPAYNVKRELLAYDDTLVVEQIEVYENPRERRRFVTLVDPSGAKICLRYEDLCEALCVVEPKVVEFKPLTDILPKEPA